MNESDAPRTEGRPSTDAVPAAARGTGPLSALAVVAVITGLCWLTRSVFRIEEQVLIYLMGVLVTAARLTRRDAALAALASVATFDFFFVPPVFAFAPTDLHHLVTLAAFLATSLIVSGYAASVRAHAASAQDRERRTSALYALSRALSAKGDVSGVTDIATREVRDLLGVDAAVFLSAEGDSLEAVAGTGTVLAGSEAERQVARWVLSNAMPAGHGTTSFSASFALHLPLAAAGGVRGVLSVATGALRAPLSPGRREFLDALAALTAVALERAVLVEDAERARLAVETERTRSALLSAISHDLRTPLASITGALGALLAPSSGLTDDARRRLLVASHGESERLGRLVANLLDLARVEAGGCVAPKEWFPLEELIASAMERVQPRLEGRRVDLDVPEEVIQLRVDGVLVEQVVENLLANAAKHTPPGSPIELRVRSEPNRVLLEVLDRGPGIAPEELERIFEGFHRAPASRAAEGTGLGLALCRAVVRAHSGRIWAENREGGGAAFRLVLPRGKEPLEPAEEPHAGALRPA